MLEKLISNSHILYILLMHFAHCSTYYIFMVFTPLLVFVIVEFLPMKNKIINTLEATTVGASFLFICKTFVYQWRCCLKYYQSYYIHGQLLL